MNNINSDFVEGQRYQLIHYHLPGSTNIETHIFISDYQLDIGEDGSVYAAKRPCETVAEAVALRAFNEKHQFRSQDESTSRELYKNLEEARKNSFATVPIPKSMVERIKSLYEQKMNGDASKNQPFVLPKEITDMIREAGLFNERREN